MLAAWGIGADGRKVLLALMAGSKEAAHAFEYACGPDIDHRLTKPKNPWTNGQVERVNRALKELTVKRYHYERHDQLRPHLVDFVHGLQSCPQAHSRAGRTSASSGRTSRSNSSSIRSNKRRDYSSSARQITVTDLNHGEFPRSIILKRPSARSYGCEQPIQAQHN